ncbi:metal-dependent transcriptional regulator [Roseivirga seohaensis]|nr:metal-dependent transcriptional regulator [Roseivirga seohaensis]
MLSQRRKDMASQTEENYLKALYSLSVGKNEVNISELSASLNVSNPTVNSMVKNLKTKGLVKYEKYKPLSLTEKGRKAAALIVRKHRLTEMFLVEKMGFGWEEVHEIAEQLEHVNSSKLFDRMDELMDFPLVDPHGSPIPDRSGNISESAYEPLSKFSVGRKVKLAALGHSSTEFLKFLNSRELSLGTEIEIKSIEPYDGSMVLSYQNHASETFTKAVCESLLVERVG